MQPRALKCTDAPRSRISVEIERARFAEVDAPLQQCIITRAFHVKVCRNRDSFFFIERSSILNEKTRQIFIF